MTKPREGNHYHLGSQFARQFGSPVNYEASDQARIFKIIYLPQLMLGGWVRCKGRSHGCFCKLGILFVGVLIIRALLLLPYIRAPDDWKLHLEPATAGWGRPEMLRAWLQLSCPLKAGTKNFLVEGGWDAKNGPQGHLTKAPPALWWPLAFGGP